jgi:hypothetical protein
VNHSIPFRASEKHLKASLEQKTIGKQNAIFSFTKRARHFVISTHFHKTAVITHTKVNVLLVSIKAALSLPKKQFQLSSKL